MKPEEAIGRIQEHIRIHSKKEPFTPYLDEAFNMAIKALERPHGEWEQVGEMTYKCTRCGWLKKIGLMPYCENCGADMKINRRKEGETNE